MVQQPPKIAYPKKISELVIDRTVDANKEEILGNSYVLVTYVGGAIHGNKNYVIKYKDVVEPLVQKYNELNEKTEWLII